MVMGMTYEQFWDGDVSAHKMYRRAYKKRIENEIDMQNRYAWISGKYILEAIASAFSDKRHRHNYPDAPYELATGRRKKVQTKEEKEIARSDNLFNAYMTQWMSHINKKFENKGGENSGGEQQHK